MSKTGGGKGTNQHAVKGVSRARVQGTAVVDDLAKKPDSVRRTYHRNGAVKEEIRFDSDGQPTRTRLYDADGLVLSECHYSDNLLDDPGDGTPAVRRYYYDGSVEAELHYRNGRPHDATDGEAASRYYRPDGSVHSEIHYCHGKVQDPPDGTPAERYYRNDGSVEREAHYRNGKKA